MAGGRRPTDGADLPASGRISQEPRPVTGPRAARTPAPDRCPRSAAVSDCHPRWHRSHAPLLRSPVCVSESGVGASARRSPGPVRCQPQRRRAVPPTRNPAGGRRGLRRQAAGVTSGPRSFHFLRSAAGLRSPLPKSAVRVTALSRRPGRRLARGARLDAAGPGRVGRSLIRDIACREKKNSHTRNAARRSRKSRSDQ